MRSDVIGRNVTIAIKSNLPQLRLDSADHGNTSLPVTKVYHNQYSFATYLIGIPHDDRGEVEWIHQAPSSEAAAPGAAVTGGGSRPVASGVPSPPEVLVRNHYIHCLLPRRQHELGRQRWCEWRSSVVQGREHHRSYEVRQCTSVDACPTSKYGLIQ